MKRLLLYFLIIFVFTGYGPRHVVPDHTLVSMAEDCVMMRDSLIIRLTDYPGNLRMPLSNLFKDHPDFRHKIMSGKPMYFEIRQHEITKVSEPEALLTRKYLSDFERYKELKASELNVNPTFDVDKCMQEFVHWCNYAGYTSELLINEQSGCEFRAEFFGSFLEKVKGIHSYKLFLKGDLRLRNHLKRWGNHCVNLVAVKVKDVVKYYVLDPVFCKGKKELLEYINHWKANGSIITHSCITTNKFMLLNFNSGLGLINRGH